MKRLLNIIGRITYFATYPALALYLSKDHRTRLVIFHEDQVLLVRSWLGNGKWDLPGGGLHRHEDPLTGVLREVSEELGLSLAAESVESIAVKSYRSGLIRYKAHYFKTILAHRPEVRLQKMELTDAQWFDVKDINNVNLNPQLREIISPDNRI